MPPVTYNDDLHESLPAPEERSPRERRESRNRIPSELCRGVFPHPVSTTGSSSLRKSREEGGLEGPPLRREGRRLVSVPGKPRTVEGESLLPSTMKEDPSSSLLSSSDPCPEDTSPRVATRGRGRLSVVDPAHHHPGMYMWAPSLDLVTLLYESFGFLDHFATVRETAWCLGTGKRVVAPRRNPRLVGASTCTVGVGVRTCKVGCRGARRSVGLGPPALTTIRPLFSPVSSGPGQSPRPVCRKAV